MGRGGLKIFLKGWGVESKKGGLFERGGINTLCELWPASNRSWDYQEVKFSKKSTRIYVKVQKLCFP